MAGPSYGGNTAAEHGAQGHGPPVPRVPGPMLSAVVYKAVRSGCVKDCFYGVAGASSSGPPAEPSSTAAAHVHCEFCLWSVSGG